MIEEGKVNNKLYRNTIIYIVNPEILRATKKSVTSTPDTLDCETLVNINSEELAYPPSTPAVSTPNAVNKNQQESFFTDLTNSSPLLAPITVTPKNTDFHADY